MSILSKIFIVLLVVLTIAVSVAVVIVHRDYMVYVNTVTRLNGELEKANAANLGLQARVDKAERATNTQIDTLTDTKTKLEEQLRLVRDDLKDANLKVQERDQELATVKLDLAKWTALANQALEERKKYEGDLAKMRGDFEKIQKDYNQVSQTLSEIEAQKEFLLRTVKLQKEQIEVLQKAGAAAGAAAGTVRPTGGEAVGPPIKGQVTAVDEDFATINVGKADGVEPGMRFTVFRGPNYLAQLVITRVEASSAVGRLELVKQRVQVADSAWSKLEGH